MGEMLIGLWIFWAVAYLVFYHKVFRVYYFDLTRGIIQELFTASIVATVMLIITLKFWWIAAIVVIIIGLSASAKAENKGPLVIAVIVAIIISVLGTNVGKSSESSGNTDNSKSSSASVDYVSK